MNDIIWTHYQDELSNNFGITFRGWALVTKVMDFLFYAILCEIWKISSDIFINIFLSQIHF